MGRARLAWADNLRVAVIAGVIVCHVSASYAVAMPWYYEERTAGPVTAALLSALFGPPVLYAMAALFFVAGLLSPASLERKGPRGFVRDRVLRLGLPLLATVVLLVPLTATVGALAEGETASGRIPAFLSAQARDLDTGVMWFAAALLLFSAAYAGLRAARQASSPCPGPLRWWRLALAMATIAVASFAVRLVWPALGDTPLHLSLWDWPSMAVLFGLGALAGERSWLDPVPAALRRTCGWLGLLAIALTTVLFGVVAVTGDPKLLGGWHAQAAILPAVEGVLAVAMSIWLVGWFQLRWRGRGPLARGLARGSYAAYVLHPLLIVLLAASLRPVPAPAELKFLAVAAAGVAASFSAGLLATRVPWLARIL